MENLENIASEALYLEQAVGFAIYKNHLVAFSQSFTIEDLWRAKSMEISGRGSQLVYVVSGLLLLMYLLRAETILVKGDSKKDKRVLMVYQMLGTPKIRDRFVAMVQTYSTTIAVIER